ncbi:MAG: inositol monophosphatase family protein [Spirochaetales bacterium]
MSQLPEISETTHAALEAALAAAAAILEVYASNNFDVESKADASPLTRADRAAHSEIQRVLAQRTPAIPILSEEGADIAVSERAGWDRFWLVDPLDGTKEFIKRNGEFTVNIALIQNGTPVSGVVAAPAGGVLYLGEVGVRALRTSFELPRAPAAGSAPHARRSSAGGSESSYAGSAPEVGGKHDAAGHTSAAAGAESAPGDVESSAAGADNDAVRQAQSERLRSILSRAVALPERERSGQRPFTIVASRSHMSDDTQAYIDAREREHGAIETTSVGSSLKLCAVAEGSADEYPRFAPTMEWDTAAGDAVARAAGCEVVEWPSGAPLRYNKQDLHNPWFLVRRKPRGDAQ